MKLNKRRRENTVAMNMTPMIDVVFLLIVFFMTVTQLSEIKRSPIQLPQLAGSADQQPTELTVNIDQHGRLVIGGRPVTISELERIVTTQLQRFGRRPELLSITLRADRHGESRGVNQVVRMLTRNRVSQVRIAVEVPQS